MEEVELRSKAKITFKSQVKFERVVEADDNEEEIVGGFAGSVSSRPSSNGTATPFTSTTWPSTTRQEILRQERRGHKKKRGIILGV